MESVVVVLHLQRTDRGAIAKGSDWVPNLLCLAVVSSQCHQRSCKLAAGSHHPIKNWGWQINADIIRSSIAQDPLLPWLKLFLRIDRSEHQGYPLWTLLV